MQSVNPIHKRRTGWGYANGRARAMRTWAANCLLCSWHGGGYTRKQAKDGLYRHVQKEH